MAKKKYQPNQVKRIRILLIIYKGSEDSPSKQGEFTLNSDLIDYNTIKQICQQFLREHQVQYQTNIYFVDTTNPYYQRILIQPGFTITAKQILTDFQGNLIFMMTSAIEQLRKSFQEQINLLKQEIGQLRLQVDFLKKPLTLELLRKNSVAPSPLLLQAHPYLSKNYSRIENYDEIQLDIAILFSEPLYDEQRKKITSPAVDFRSQITRVHGALQNSFKPSIIMRCQIATFQTLQTTIKYSKPKIMHIICHGNNEGSLEFEDDSRNTLGLLQLLKPINLKNLLKSSQKDLLPELVFINSCHSEKVGRAFFQLGVPNVVMINSEDLISDEAAQIFSQNFYRKIFKGTTISQAFTTSKSRVEQKFVGQCCCNHSLTLQPHRQQCQWYRMYKAEPIQSHRSYHVAKCDCEQKNKNMHSFKCEWAKKTLFQINKDFRIQEIKDDGSKHYVFPAHISKFPSYVKESGSNSLTICCCPPKEGKPHSESIKFLMLSSNNGEKVLMPVIHNREHPEITDLTSTELLEAHQKSKAIFGRQRQLFQFLKNMQDTNFMYVYGKTGVGLTTFTIKASTYMMQRRVFQFFFFFDLYDIKDVTVFRYKFNEITKFQYNGTSVVDFGIKNKKILLLFDNCDSFINQDPQKFYQQMQNLLRQFPKCKIITTFKQQTRGTFVDKKINEVNLGYQLLPFEQRPAAFFLHGKIRNKVQMSVGMKQLRSLIKKYEVLKIPKVIQSLSQSIPITRKNITLDELVKKVQQIKISDTNSLTKSVLNQLNQTNHEAYQFLVFCSLFSDGVTFQDINMFSSYFKPGTSILPIRKNWEDHYLLLLQKQPSTSTSNLPSHSVPKLQTSFSYSQQANVHPEQRPKLEMKKKQSEEVLTPLITKQNKGEFDRLNKLGTQSYFIDRNGSGKFIVKRFIRDYLWKSHLNQTTNQTKFLFVAYFSVILQMLFDTLKAENYIHEQLTTYSAISSAGIFKFKTKMRDVYAEKSLTQSVRFGLNFMNDLKDIFMNNEQLQEKMKKTDHSTFIMNHRQDFLKFYDTQWYDVYTHLLKKGKGQEKLFVILLENLMVYIPTAFKIAGAEQTLLQYVLKRSQKQLTKFRQYSQKDRNLKILLKLYMIRLGISLQSTATEIKSIFISGYKNIDDCKVELEKLRMVSLQIQDITQVLKMQQFCCSLILDDKRLKMQQSSHLNHIINQKNEFLNAGQQFAALQPLIQAKQGLVIASLFLKFMQNNRPELTIALKTLTQNNQFKSNEIVGILMICQNSIQIFKKKGCVKLQLKTRLVAIELFWVFNEKTRSKTGFTTEEIDFWSKKLIQCEHQFNNQSNRLRGFTQFDDKIKQLKQKTKEKYWVSASKRLIFMKAYPLSSKQQPILKNLIRKKNNFRQEIQKILAKKSRQQGDRSDRRNQQSPSIRQISNVSHEQKRSLDISTKYQILTGNKVGEQARAKCSIMFLNVDIKSSSGKVYLICQNQIMQEELVELNHELAANLNMDNMLIVVLTGVNTRKAMAKILEYNDNPPVIICLESQPLQNQGQIDFIHEIDSKFIRQLIKRQNQIKQAQLVYTKTFIQIIISSQITKKQEILYIHEKASKMMQNVSNCHVKSYIELAKCRQKLNLKFNPGVYRDLSPGYEGNHNIDSRSYDSAVSIRRWRKMIEFFKFLNLKKSHLIQAQEKRKNLFSSGYSKEQVQFKVDLPGTYINIYGENACGKTYFIREIAKILVQREFYDFGVFLFEGKRIQKQFNGDFQAYIKKQSNLGRMPVLDDFQRLLSDKTILIVDDFHVIKSRVNARMKIFLDKVISKKVNLVLVTLTQLKLQSLPVIKKIKLESLDALQTEVLAYNIINISNEDELAEFQRLKNRLKQQNRNPTVKQIQLIDKTAKGSKRKVHNQRTVQKLNQHHQQETSAQEGQIRKMKKSFTSYQKQ